MSNSRSSHSTRTAFNFRNTVRIFTDQFTFRLRTSGFVTFPVASGFFANSFAFRLRGLAVSNTVGLFADSYTFRTVIHFATFVGTFDFTFRFFTFNIANSVSGFSAGSVAFRGFANGVTNSGTMGVVAFPGTLRMALSGGFSLY